METLAAEIRIIEYICQHGKAYSRELVNKGGVKLKVWRVLQILRDLEERGELISFIKHPPFPDKPNGGMRRRYYYRRAPGGSFNLEEAKYNLFRGSLLLHPIVK